MTNVSKAVELFKSGCACSQAIAATYMPAYGVDEGTALRISAGFAGGMRTGEVCGAVTGAYMTLGLKHCSNDSKSMSGRQAAYSAVVEFGERFAKKNGSILCSKLLGCDMNTPEGKKLAQDKGLFTSVCPKLVGDAAEILEDML